MSEPAFEIALRTRGYETDASTTIPIAVIFNYLEHLRWEWMHYEPLGLRSSLDAGHFFVVRDQAVEVLSAVGMRTDLRARGIVETVGRSLVHVRHELLHPNGDPVAVARVSGLWLSPERRLVRVPDKLREYATSQVDALAAAPAPPTIAPPEGDAPAHAHCHTITVRPSDLDRFDHVNAATYLRFFEDAALAASSEPRPRPMRAAIRYEREALAGDALRAKTWRHEDGYAFLLCRGDDVLCRAMTG